jgi:hypothetical protein
MKNEFELKVENWLTEVADGCHTITTNPEFNMDLDFYPLQSDIYPKPKLLVIGINPGGGMRYSAKNQDEKRERRGAHDLKYSTNQFIEHFNDKSWSKLKPLCTLFDGEILRPIFEKAVITNLIYFNSGTFAAFRNQKGYKAGSDFCLKKNFDLISLVEPETILLMGKPVKDLFSRYLDSPLLPVLKTVNEKTVLISISSYKTIPVFWIQHPSAFGINSIFNFDPHQKAKQDFFEGLFSVI